MDNCTIALICIGTFACIGVLILYKISVINPVDDEMKMKDNEKRV